jgi:hypothetical protein
MAGNGWHGELEPGRPVRSCCWRPESAVVLSLGGGCAIAWLLLTNLLVLVGLARLVPAVRAGPWFWPRVGEELDPVLWHGPLLGAASPSPSFVA